MNLLKIARNFAISAGLLAPLASFGDDIDIFKGGTAVTGQTPNVLIIIDNGASWNSANQQWPGGIVQGQAELQSMSAAIGALTGGNVNIGLMAFVKGTGPTNNGGYVRFAIRNMNTTNITAIQNLLSGWYSDFKNENSGQQVASANTDYGAAMYEAFKYFSGSSQYAAAAALRDYSGNGSVNVSNWTAGNLTGNAFSTSTSTTYNSPLSANTPCNKNFIIFIGNGFPSTSSVNPTTLGDPLLANFNATQIYAEGTKTTYLDEWARFLYSNGVGNVPCNTSVTPNVCADGKVTTYTIDVYNAQQDTAETALLKSTATVGGGKYFAATSTAAIQDALTRILNEIQAVNSVFTSASLPVSVNTQGTYLNQIYMGVFRPDGGGAPRWYGNLKQYKFGLTTDASGNDTIFLADADGNAAVNSITGFVNPSARSYWSSSVSPAAGFWAFNPTGTGLQYDSPDGDIVEKGGAAQRLRTQGPTGNYATHATAPYATGRTIYTCSGTTCSSSGVTPASFDTSNTDLVSTLTSTSASVTSLTRSGTTVSVTTSADLGLSSPTDTVSISGASVSSYNTSVTATKVDATHFTFPISETPVTPATGASITVSSGTSIAQSVSSGGMTFNSSNGLVTVNLPAHGFINGQTVTIAGASVSSSMSNASTTTKCTGWTSTATCEYNGTFSITYIDSNNFSYTPPTSNFGLQTTTIGTTTTYNPVDGTITPGTATITCAAAGSVSANTGTVTVNSVTKATQSTTGSMQIKVTLASVPTACGGVVRVGGSGNNGRITAFSITGTGSSVLDGVAQTVSSLGVGSSCTTGTANSSTLVVCFNATVTSATTTQTGTATIVPASPATGTITATGIPTRTVSSITRTAGNSSNVATVTVTTSTAHGFSAASSVTISGADQTAYNGAKTTAANALSFPTSTTMTFTLTTGPTSPATGASASKGSSINATTLINWIRGVDDKDDENINGSLTDCRASIHGDVLHSRPLVVNYGGSGTDNIYAFYGSNDGTFHAVKAGQVETQTTANTEDGNEVWSFIAPEHYSTLGRLYNNSPLIQYVGTTTPNTPRNYFFDGNIGVFQSADLATTNIFISMRRGGRFIYALDVSAPKSPKFLWKKSYTDTGMSELGYTWSEPKVIPIRKTAGVACKTTDSGLSTDASSSYIRALVFSAGYDPTSDDTAQLTSPATVRPVATMGRGVFVLNAADGSLIKLLQAPANDYTGNNNSTRLYPIPSDVTVVDSNGDGCVDRIYAGDTGGKMHRFDIDDANSANWKAYTIGTFGDIENDGGSNDRKFLFPPEVVLGIVNAKQVAYVMAGTGNREQPSSSVIQDNFYMIRDTILLGDAVATSAATTNAVGDTQMTQVTVFNSTSTGAINSAVVNGASCTKTSAISTTTPCFFGWFLPFDAGEKSVNAALTVAGSTFFGTNTPQTVNPLSCSANLGTARGYAVNFLSGTSAAGDRDGNGAINRTDMYSVFKGGGLPPSPVSGVVQISASKTVRFVIGSGGTGTTGSAIEGVKTQVNPSGTRTRVFWYFKKDD